MPRIGELGAVTAFAAFGFDVFGGECPLATIQIALHGNTLRFYPKTTAALLVGAYAQI